MNKIYMEVDPKDLWKFQLDDEGHKIEPELIEDVTLEEKQLAIIEHYGFENQLDKLVEECGELIQAIMKCELRNKESIERFDNVIGEIADVKNIITQLELYWPYMKEGVKVFTKCKVDRELDRILAEKIEKELERIEADGDK